MSAFVNTTLPNAHGRWRQPRLLAANRDVCEIEISASISLMPWLVASSYMYLFEGRNVDWTHDHT